MADRYRPLFKLDAGGMAEVYVAEAESMAGFKKKVAIKRILPGLLKDERFVRMFLDEARLSLHLSHANVVSVFDIGKSSSTYFIVMEYVEGPNLKHVLQYLSKRRATMPVHLAVWVLGEILKGLDYAHNLRDPETRRPLGIVHRDISPPNILFSWNGEVKLTDFGLAKASTQLESTDPGVVKGKFSYLSPEAAHGHEVDARSDIFAVGILAFEMLTGERLFLGESDYKTVELVRAAEVPSISARNPDVPPELERIIRRALSRELDTRYQTASDFADDLLGFLFSRSLKVSSRALSELLEEMRSSQPSPSQPSAGGTSLILQLIDEEFLNFKSLGEDDAPETGSQPLDSMMSGAADYDGAAPLGLDGFDDASAGGALGLEPEPTASASAARAIEPEAAAGEAARRDKPARAQPSGPHPAVKGPRAPTRMPSPAPRKEGSAMPWIVLALLLALGGGAYYWLVVLGNLGRFTG
ncbi:MAG: serine/threonine protein kinase [Nannocystaceae bacterium]|nr:serine/threonine protein kinase [Nannocystaceae bacterium]